MWGDLPAEFTLQICHHLMALGVERHLSVDKVTEALQLIVLKKVLLDSADKRNFYCYYLTINSKATSIRSLVLAVVVYTLNFQ